MLLVLKTLTARRAKFVETILVLRVQQIANATKVLCAWRESVQKVTVAIAKAAKMARFA